MSIIGGIGLGGSGTSGGVTFGPVGISGVVSVYSGAFNPPFVSDAIGATYPNSVTEVFLFYSGGLAGVLLSTVTVAYTDSTKASLLSVVRT